MIKEEIKNRILMEMNEFVGGEVLRKLKLCIDRNFYGVEMSQECTDLVITNTISNEDMLNKFICLRNIEGLSVNTLAQYKRETERFFSIINKNYVDVRADDINYYLATLKRTGISINSVDNARKFLKPFFKWLYENEYIQKDIFVKVKPIKRVEKEKDYLNDAEIVKLRDSCQQDKRALAVVDFLLSTGLRVSECSNLKIKDIDFVNGEVKIYATKTSQWRKVYLDSSALKHLQDYINSRKDYSPYVFVNVRRYKGEIGRMKNSSIQRIIQKYCAIAKINRHCHVHLFRKTLATRLYKHGIDISIIAKILGHNSVRTTEKHYLSIREQEDKYIYQRCMA